MSKLMIVFAVFLFFFLLHFGIKQSLKKRTRKQQEEIILEHFYFCTFFNNVHLYIVNTFLITSLEFIKLS